MQNAREGDVVRLPDRGPSWIVVDFDLSKVVVARWPGKLWRVRIQEAANPRDQDAVGGPPTNQATYVRVISVEVVVEESPHLLFGAHGAKLLPLLESAARLSHSDADLLANARHPAAATAYDRVMRRWAKHQNITISSDALDGVLKIDGGSPINGALSVLYRIINDRAHAMDGAKASTVTDDEVYLAEPWASAAKVMLDAALALGAPHLAEGRDREALLSGWLSLSSASGART